MGNSRIVGISDTHTYHDQVIIPDGDILLCVGDITHKGELKSIQDFASWMQKLPHAHKLVCYGNHELTHDRPGLKKDAGIKIIRDAGLTYLEDESVVIDGCKIHMSAASPFFFNWAFNYQRGPEIAAVWAKIPDDVNVLCTHSPPYMILDGAPRGYGPVEHVGCQDLTNRLGDLHNLKAHFFGHIHREKNEPAQVIGGVSFCNVSVTNNAYKVVNNPIVIDLP